MIFFKKAINKESINLVKFHLIIDPKNIDDHIFRLVELYENITKIGVRSFSLNYKNPISTEKLKSKTIDASDLEALSFYSDMDAYCFGFGKIFLEKKSIVVFDFDLFYPTGHLEESALRQLLCFLSGDFRVVYGYARWIPENYFPSSESPIKKSIFGNTSIEIKKFGSDWLINPENMLSTGIKGFYPYNFVNQNVLDLPIIKKIINSHDVSVDQFDEGVFCLHIPNAVLESIRKENRDIREYIRD